MFDVIKKEIICILQKKSICEIDRKTGCSFKKCVTISEEEISNLL